jgi:hypothetical protein
MEAVQKVFVPQYPRETPYEVMQGKSAFIPDLVGDEVKIVKT